MMIRLTFSALFLTISMAASANAASFGCVAGLSAEKPFLSVRSEPGDGGKVLHRLSNGDPVIVAAIRDEIRVIIIVKGLAEKDVKGWVLAKYIREAKAPEECVKYKRTGE